MTTNILKLPFIRVYFSIMLPNKLQKEFDSLPLERSEGARKLLVIGHNWPEPKTTAAGNRMLQLLEAFLNKNYQITFASTASKTEYSHDLTSMGIQEVTVQLNDSGFDRFVKELNPNIVMFDRFMAEEQFGWRVAEACPIALRLLNTEDLHSLRDYREKCTKKNVEWTAQEWVKQDKTKREIASIYRSDLTLLVSSFEKNLLENKLGIHDNLLLHLPFMLHAVDSSKVSHWPKFQDRQDFISLGNGRHAPNVDTFRFLKETIWPLIRKELPKAQLHIYGAYLPQQIKQMHHPKVGFLVHGWMEHLEVEVQKARVVLAPLRFGAGIKGKLAFAMQNGTPSVTTTIGAEGMSTDNAWSGFVEDNPENFAKKAVALYHEENTWQNAQKKGFEILRTHFDKTSLEKAFFQRIGSLTQELENHRNQNLIGALLQHQTMAATKFMGKWIEEKNKPQRG
jgi:glycosyltransferase involved in cell wall biosynthesis